MPHETEQSQNQPAVAAVEVEEIARSAEAPPTLVQDIYDEEIVALNEQAKIKQFISVIAIKRVKQRLRHLGHRH